MPPPFLIEPSKLDTGSIIAGREEIRQANLQRYEMEQLDAICSIDPEQHLIIGYKDVREDEFWVRGHFPKRPLLPGVLICEAAAQLVSYYCITQNVISHGLIGFGGMEEVRFRGPVRPGDRLVLIAKGKRVRRLQSVFDAQGLVANNLVFHGVVIGVPLGETEADATKGSYRQITQHETGERRGVSPPVRKSCGDAAPAG